MADLVDKTAPAWKGRANEVLARFNGLPTNKKILFFTALAAVLSIALALLVFNREPAYKVLFTGLNDRDGAGRPKFVDFLADAGGLAGCEVESS